MVSRISVRPCDFCKENGNPEPTNVELCDVDGEPMWLCDACIEAFGEDEDEPAEGE